MPCKSDDTGYARGERDARLDAHDRILKSLQLVQMFSIVSTFFGIGWLGLSTQRLGDGARATAASTLMLAQALKEEKDTARDTLAADNTSSQSKWSKSNTLIAAFGMVITVIVAIGSFYLATR